MTTVCTVADCGRPTDAFLCGDCAERLDDAFGDLPGLVDDLVTAATRQTRVYRATRRRGVPDEDWRPGDGALEPMPDPANLDALALLHRAGNTLTTWARHLAEHRGLTVESARLPAEVVEHVHVTVVRNRWRITRESRIIRTERSRALSDLVRWMLAHVDAIRFDEAAAEIHDEITRLRDDVLRAVDRAPSPFYAGPCHAMVTEPTTTERGGTIYVQTVTRRCERDLYAWLDIFRYRGDRREVTITCDGLRSREPGDQGCGTEHTLAGRDEWLLASVDDALLPLATWQTALPRMFPEFGWPPAATVRSWRMRGRLAARSVDRYGVELFRGGDVIERLRDERIRTGPKRRTA